MSKLKRVTLIILTLTIMPNLYMFNASAEDINLANGCDYKITAEAVIDNAFPEFAENDSAKKLTNGNKATDDHSNAEWLKLYRGNYRYIDIDLGSEKSIRGFSIGFMRYMEQGIYPAREIKFQVSNNGTDFYTITEINDRDILLNKTKQKVTVDYTSDNYYKARYVRLSLSCDVHMYIDEVEIIGTESDNVSNTNFTPDEQTVYTNAFPTSENTIEGLTDLVLIYNSLYYNGAESNIGKNTYNDLLPYVAYIDSSKQIYDIMFDSFLYLPLNPGDAGEYKHDNQFGIQTYIDNTIGKEEDINLTAMNRLVGDVKETLKLDDSYKAKIYISIPFIKPSSAVFGNLDGDTGVAPNNFENRKKVVEWIADTTVDAFMAESFENLELVGLYWHEELVNYTLSDYEEELIIHFNEHVHAKDLKTIWIPYYVASGSLKWRELGFDCATLQSGYAFPSDTNAKKPESVEDSMLIAKKYGLGVEFEIGGTSTDHIERYQVYLDTAYEVGASEGITMFYQGGGPGSFFTAAYSNNSALRGVYDKTYEYINVKREERENTPPVLEFEGSLMVLKNSTRNRGTLKITDNDSLKSHIKIIDIERTTNGEISIENNGFIYYLPNTDFVGEDSFSFKLTDGKATSELYTIKILVLDDLLQINGIDEYMADNKVVLYSSSENTGTEGTEVYEVVIGSDMKVISAGYASNSVIPENGYVISAKGEKVAWLEENAKPGSKAVMDLIFKSVVFEEEKAAETNNGILKTAIIISGAVLAVAAAGLIIYKLFRRGKRK